jgi:hypothetical protein
MGRANTVPMDFPLGCVLKYWECFHPGNLKREHYYCNETWSQYLLGLQDGVKIEVLIMTPSYS